jgi:hypothetical protein
MTKIKTVPMSKFCPFCGEEGHEANEIIIPEARDATVVYMDSELHIWGKGT